MSIPVQPNGRFVGLVAQIAECAAAIHGASEDERATLPADLLRAADELDRKFQAATQSRSAEATGEAADGLTEFAGGFKRIDR